MSKVEYCGCKDENQCLEAHHRFAGKVVVVTGGASGIGEATARLFVEHGAYVVIADINKESGSRLSAELGDTQSRFVSCDVRKEQDVAALVDEAMRWKGKLDVYYSNAGFVGALGSIEELSLEDFDETLAVNLRGKAISIPLASFPSPKMRSRHSLTEYNSSSREILLHIRIIPHCEESSLHIRIPHCEEFLLHIRTPYFEVLY